MNVTQPSNANWHLLAQEVFGKEERRRGKHELEVAIPHERTGNLHLPLSGHTSHLKQLGRHADIYSHLKAVCRFAAFQLYFLSSCSPPIESLLIMSDHGHQHFSQIYQPN